MQLPPQQVGIVTYYSDQYEPQCPLCQSGEHSSQTESNFIQSAHTMQGQQVRGRVVYTSPERIVSRKLIEGVAISPMQLRQQQAISQQQAITPPRVMPITSQIINTPPIIQQKSPILIQQSPVILQQATTQINQSPIAVNSQSNVIQQAIYQPQIPQIQQQYQAQPQIQQSQINQTNMSTQFNQQLQQSQLIQQELLLKQKEWADKYYQQTEEIQQNHLAYSQLQAQYQEQLEQYEALKNAYSLQTQYQAQNFIPSFLQTVQYKVITKDGKCQYSQEEIELYWRHQVYQLEEQMYLLWEKINQKKQKKDLPIKSDDSQKIEQLQQEVGQLEHIQRMKMNSLVILRNKLNDLMYQHDPATEATREHDLHLQQLRQKVMQLNSKLTDIQDEIQMAEAQNEAIRSGKGFKFVSIKQTSSSVRQVNNSIRTNQAQDHQIS
ncbi:unnamed protein product [Paramecium sonneborni]|uniref:Uncharacterized protein n=1 Tax=Paramecium sonneborni TaxID=65129 RepID=A0A8S1LAY8_9CILI|nr:unnamed protein product [Paramecium sonneborni]